MKISNAKLRKQKRNQDKFHRYISLTEDNIVHHVFYARAGIDPKDIDNFYKIPKELDVEIGDRVKISEDGIKIIREGKEEKKSWWKFS